MLKKLPLLAPLLLAACNQIPLDSPAASTKPTPQIPTTFPEETPIQKDVRMLWWREARFGMFIHWGIYSVPAGIYKGQNIPSLGEWIMNNGNIPVADYAQFAAQFNPTKFNADTFVAIAKNAGMKYIVITAKHHDGFAMFKSADPFNIVDATPFRRDIIKELETAAHKAGLRFGVYYSQSQDWHHPGGYALGRNSRPNGTHWDPAQDGSFDTYLNNVAIPQTKELLSNYKLDVLWWDTPANINKDEATKLHNLLALQPSIISNNRLMNTKTPGAFQGDTETPEQNIPATGYPAGRDWETCMTINDTWGYKSTDTNFKSPELLIHNLIDIASKGGNYLLNVGPTAEGLIPQPEIDRLTIMGQWLKTNGEAIYATGPNPFPRPPAAAPATAPGSRPARAPIIWDWRATTRLDQNKIYLHIMQWPATGQFTIPTILYPGTTISRDVAKAYLLADPTHAPLGLSKVISGAVLSTILTLPPTAPDPIATVICLELTDKN